jgi:hypothetical protein
MFREADFDAHHRDHCDPTLEMAVTAKKHRLERDRRVESRPFFVETMLL